MYIKYRGHFYIYRSIFSNLEKNLYIKNDKIKKSIRKTERQNDRKTERQKDRQTDRQTKAPIEEPRLLTPEPGVTIHI